MMRNQIIAPTVVLTVRALLTSYTAVFFAGMGAAWAVLLVGGLR